MREEDDISFVPDYGLGPSYVRLYDCVVNDGRNMNIFDVPTRKNCGFKVAARLIAQLNYAL